MVVLHLQLLWYQDTGNYVGTPSLYLLSKSGLLSDHIPEEPLQASWSQNVNTGVMQAFMHLN